jgi:hypothetical protein
MRCGRINWVVIEVAEVYRAAAHRGEPPTIALTNHFGITRSTAGKWIARARLARAVRTQHQPKEKETIMTHEIRQAMQDLEDLMYYWPGPDHGFDRQMRELVAAGFLDFDGNTYTMTTEGQAWVEEQRRQDPHY